MKTFSKIKDAIEFIVGGKHNLMRVTGYICTHHEKEHEFSFHSRVTFTPGTERFYGFDTEREVIDFANELKKNNGKHA